LAPYVTLNSSVELNYGITSATVFAAVNAAFAYERACSH
jgi:hypothetical protein